MGVKSTVTLTREEAETRLFQAITDFMAGGLIEAIADMQDVHIEAMLEQFQDMKYGDDVWLGNFLIVRDKR